MTLTDSERDRLRQRLMQYRGATEESVADELEMHEERAEVKKHLMAERGMSNTLAEVFLERQGYPRPPGWHSVFFYPSSNRPRNKVLFFFAIIAALAYVFLF